MALLIGVLVFPNLFKEGTGSVNTLHSFDSRKKQTIVTVETDFCDGIVQSHEQYLERKAAVV